MPRGTIKTMQYDRGFGFITPDEGGPDLFLHMTAVVGCAFAQLQREQRVEFDHGTDPRNPERTRAVNVRPVEE